ncbi:helix-turn-helix transcriptional regulator [Winogradskyella sp.]|uniref:helix-turn-helix domain-containing protein n=1 Tax=Winogradskyella sp. TaxID=1883156 RepID=UPI001B272909|nr:helix-turn-helix transcriptional regulator [Winogradskyella sp.]MBO6881445.1 helix-turn-helix transcriptional regulator [Winogradskyella sp.]
MTAKKREIPEPVKQFGQKILKIRLEKNLSQMDVGALIGIDRENIRKYEKGIQEPRLTTIVKFAKGFEVDFNELLSYKAS